LVEALAEEEVAKMPPRTPLSDPMHESKERRTRTWI
jgi:hypothetical protein